MDDATFDKRTKLYRKLCDVMDSDEFCDEDPKALAEARKIQGEISTIDLEGMSPRSRMHEEIQAEIRKMEREER